MPNKANHIRMCVKVYSELAIWIRKTMRNQCKSCVDPYPIGPSWTWGFCREAQDGHVRYWAEESSAELPEHLRDFRDRRAVRRWPRPRFVDVSWWVKHNNKPPIWEWFIPPIYMVIWGMVYYCFIPIDIWTIIVLLLFHSTYLWLLHLFTVYIPHIALKF